MSVLRGLLVPVHGPVYRQAQPQVTPSPQHGYKRKSQVQFFASPSTSVPATTSSSASPDDVASSVVQQSVANAANSLTGLAVQEPLEVPGQLFQSAGWPVGAYVSEKLRAKIWSNEYIDFGSLLTNPVFKDQYRLTFQGADSGLVPPLRLEPVSKPKKI